MTISISLDGIEYDGWDEAYVERSIDNCASSFGFSTSSKEGKIIPIQEGDLVRIYTDGTLKTTGYIDSYEVGYDPKSHDIIIKGRSKTQDFIDSTVPSIKEWENYSLYNLCKTIAAEFNIDVIDLANAKDPFLNVIGAELGETCFDFVKKFAARRQVLLTDDEYGRLVLSAPSQDLSDLSLQNIIGSENNNIKSANRKTNLAELFGVYIAQIQGYPVDVTEFDTVQELIKTSEVVVDPEIRNTRLLEFFVDEIITINNIDIVSDIKQRAKWEMAMRRAKNFNYTATVAGHSYSGKQWVENMLYQIDDDFTNIKGQFFCNKIRWNYNLASGSTTTLNFTNKNAYTLQAERDKIILTDD